MYLVKIYTKDMVNTYECEDFTITEDGIQILLDKREVIYFPIHTVEKIHAKG